MDSMRVTTHTDVVNYAEAVRAALQDLPTADREAVTKDLDGHLGEVAQESGVPLSARLGPPDEYANELRNSAGLPPPTAEPHAVGLFTRLLERASDDMAHIVPVLRPALQPAWWLLRGAVAAVLAAMVCGGLLVAAFGIVGLIAAFIAFVVLGVTGPVASVMLGRHASMTRAPAVQVFAASTSLLVAVMGSIVLVILARFVLLGL